MTDKLVSIIIPSRKKDNIAGLLEDISKQKKYFNIEIIRITGIYPPGRARNEGAEKARGQILVFIDCDIRLGSDCYLSNLVECLEKDKNIGAACASIQPPPDASSFQHRYVQEIPHSESPVVDRLTDVFVAPSACFAIFREVFFTTGGFNEYIIRGEDSELSIRLIKAKYRLTLVPYTWCYHPSPDNLWQLVKTNLRNGKGVSFVDIFYPELNIDVHPGGIVYLSEQKTKKERIKRFISSGCRAVLGMKILLVLSKIFYGLGYLFGVIKYKLFSCKRKNGARE